MKNQVSLAFHDVLGRWISVTKKVQEFLVKHVLHALIIPVLLFAFYFLVLGLTSLIIRSLFTWTLRTRYSSPSSYWIEAKGYEADPELCHRQS